ncbi:AraC family transcriptional regulator [Janthinobacterium sp.]|uniref:AraC family transcriptional regulator n=1 Tax=Janthinobacterium sp. TaxID=1871054 RepID=UPI00293D4A4E|nr:AraC family transcriptional regulator [Janthinobacterium sp.]
MMHTSTAGAWINGIADMLAMAGMDTRAAFAAAGIEPGPGKDVRQRYDTDQLSRLWQGIAAASGDAAIALAGSEQPRPASIDLLAYTMMTAPTLAAALERLVRYMRVISDAAAFTLEAGDGGVWLRVHIEGGRVPVPRQRYEFILITLLNVCRWVAGKALAPTRVDFTAAEPADPRPYAKAFGCPLRFAMPGHGMLFAAADLEAALPASNPPLAELHERHAGDFILQMDGARLAPEVRRIIARHLPDGVPARGVATAGLCISERTLQRRLSDEGTSFQQLLDDTRRELMRQYLGAERIALGQVAFMLGFADQSAFCRACRRWFASSPSQFRKQLRAARS